MKRRLRIAFLTRGVFTPYGFLMWKGLKKEADAGAIDLLTFDAGCNLAEPGSFIYRLLDPSTLDGLIAWAHPNEKHADFYATHLPGVPVVGLTAQLPGLPVVKIDCLTSMKEVMRHLIVEHGRRKIAFLRSDAAFSYNGVRWQGYLEGLQENGVELDEKLVVEEIGFPSRAGVIAKLVEERGLVPGKDFDAILACGEDATIELVRELLRRGVRVPQDVAYASYENSVVGRLMNPTPTAQVLPYDEQSLAALDLLRKRIEKFPVPDVTLISPHLFIGGSCGCEPRSRSLARSLSAARDAPGTGSPGGSRGREVASSGLPAETGSWEDRRRNSAGAFLRHVRSSYGRHALDDLLETLYLNLVAAFAAELGGEVDAFRTALAGAKSLFTEAVADARALNDAVSHLRELEFPGTHSAESRSDLLTLARVEVTELIVRMDRLERARMEEEQGLLRRFVTEVSVTDSEERLGACLALWVPRLGLPGLHLVLFEDPRRAAWGDPLPPRSRLFFSFREGRRSGSEGVLFDTARILPDEAGFPVRTARDMHVLPLVSGTLQLGYLLFEGAPCQSGLFVTVSSQISNSVLSLLLLRKREEAKVRLADAARSTRDGAEEVARESGVVSGRLDNVAASMGDLVREIAAIEERIREVGERTTRAAGLAGEAGSRLEELEEIAEQILGVSARVSGITRKANLLSMNARIEAAHAGRAGGGFAIVAQEINHLSEETRRGAAVIDQRIRRVLEETAVTSGALAEIGRMNRAVADTARSIRSETLRHGEEAASIDRRLSRASGSAKEIDLEVQRLARLEGSP